MNGGAIFALIFVILIIIGLVIGGIIFWVHEENKNKKPSTGGGGGGTGPADPNNPGGTGPNNPGGSSNLPSDKIGVPGTDFSFRSTGTNFYSSQYTVPPDPANRQISGSFLINNSNITPTCKSAIFTFNNFVRKDGTTIPNAIVWKEDPTKILCYSSVPSTPDKLVFIDNPDTPNVIYYNPDPGTLGSIPSNKCSWLYGTTTKNICASDDSNLCLNKLPVNASALQEVTMDSNITNPLYLWDITSPISSPLCTV